MTDKICEVCGGEGMADTQHNRHYSSKAVEPIWSMELCQECNGKGITEEE